MKLLKEWKFAILITIVVVIIATLLGVRGSLNRLARDVEAMFYDGVHLEGEGYTQPAINAQLENRRRSAFGLAMVMENHPELAGEAGALLSAQRELIDSESIREKYTANENMQRAFVALTEKAQRLNLSEREKEDIEHYSSTFLGAQAAIQNSQYNQKARSFMEGASFFAYILRPILFISSPQVFA